MHFSKHNINFLVGIFLFFLVEVSWLLGFFYAPVDRIQGEVYRIIFLHVPSALTAFLLSFILLTVSIKSLMQKTYRPMQIGKATAEVGLLFTILTLITGSIWGRPTWGVYWTWDARLTTTLILALLYSGYLLLYGAFSPSIERNRACGILGILIAACVPIVYKSVTWWRTLHQPPSLFRADGNAMSSEIYNTLYFAIITMILFSIWLLRTRSENLQLREAIEAKTMQAR
ncbi:MAG: cytochrome c biogenesis protein CcsA [Oligoflexales bacterium]|nr:cytochrome c biogenesis protein CcsA [Oligoflexales bacterium]